MSKVKSASKHTTNDEFRIASAVNGAEQKVAKGEKDLLAMYHAVAVLFMGVRDVITLNSFTNRWTDRTGRSTSTIRTVVTYVVKALDAGYDIGSFDDVEHLLQVVKRGGEKRDQSPKRKAIINESTAKKATAKQLRDALAVIKAEMKARGL